jgi:hypothetical protein
VKILAPALLVLAACASATGAMIDLQSATAHVQPSERERVLANAARILQREGWILEKQDPSAGVVTTQTMATGAITCGVTICNSRGTLQVTVSEAGDVSVMLHREFYNPPPGLGWFTPSLDQDVYTIEREQQKLLQAILEPNPGK